MTAFDLYSGWFYRSGMLQLATTMGWGAQMLREDARRNGNLELARQLDKAYAQPAGLYADFPHSQVQPLTDPMANGYVRDWLEHETYDSYWQAVDVLSHAATLAEVPCFHLAGWYDYYLRGSMDGYRALAALAPDKQRLVIGPWIHIPWTGAAGDFPAGDKARYPVDEALVKWMHHWCDGEGTEDWAAVEYFRLGDNRWMGATSWPPENVVSEELYFSSHGNANSLHGDGTLETVASAVAAVADRYVVDPEVPMAAPGAGPSGYRWGPVDIAAGMQGNQLVVYRSAPAPVARNYAGQPQVTLFARTHAVDTAFVVRLSMQRGARIQFLCLGAARLRDGERHADGSVKLTIKLDDIAFQLGEGERICVDVAGGAYPLLARHPNTEKALNAISDPLEMRRSTHIILHDAEHPSCIQLPLLKSDATS
jgi:putative CocE/NonD family hydrolase